MTLSHRDPAPVWVRTAAEVTRRLPRARYRIIDLLCRRPPLPFMMRMPAAAGGYRFACDLRDAIARDVCFTGRYEPQETALVDAVLRPGMTFVDVGANWGYFTLLAAHRVGVSGRVISLEPDPRLFTVLSENVCRNRLEHIDLRQLAASDGVGSVTLQGYDEDAGNFGVSHVIGADGDTHTSGRFQAPCDRLDNVIANSSQGEVDLLKMDIEGAEAWAIDGLVDSLREHRVKRVLIELHPSHLAQHGRSVADIARVFRGAGYRGLTVDHSPAATRAAAYSRAPDIRQFLRPWVESGTLDEWPHQLWIAPDVADV